MDRWSEARNVLCVRLDSMGDVLMSGPAMSALRAVRPGRRVTLLTSASGAAAGELMGCVDEVLRYEAPWMKATGERTDTGPDDRILARLRAMDFDAAVIFTVFSQSALPAALLCHLAGIPLRLAHCREKPYGLLTDWVPEREPEELVRHEVRRQLDLVATVGAMEDDERLSVDVPADARERVEALLEEFELQASDRWVVVHPGSSAPSRRYPAEGYVAACRELSELHGVRIVFTGGPDECELVDSIRAELSDDAHSLAGRLDLPELAALLSLAPLLVAGNTGPVHVAAAVGTPVVDLYALTNPQHAPWGVPSRVLFRDVACRWCHRSECDKWHHHCLRGVAPSEVAEAAAELLDVDRREVAVA
jgi:lipopolysaccharide heptosyltransferase II